MSNKKGIELSINFLVILIISIVVISLGIRFVYQLVSETSKLEDISAQELDRLIGNVVCADETQVCIPKDRKEIAKGNFEAFGIKITNIKESGADFQVVISKCQYLTKGLLAQCPPGYLTTIPKVIPSDTSAFSKGEHSRIKNIASKKDESITIAVEATKDAVSTTYVLDIDIYSPSGDNLPLDSGNKYTPTKKINVEVR